MRQLPAPKPIIYPVNHLLATYKVSSDYYELVDGFSSTVPIEVRNRDLKHAVSHLMQFKGSRDTMGFYRTELMRFLNWSWLIANKSICDLKREHIIEYIDFAVFPPSTWVSEQTDYAFIDVNGQLEPNVKWRPFIESEKAKLAQGTIETVFSRLSAFYTSLMSEAAIDHNPVKAIRQKNTYKRKGDGTKSPKVLTDAQIRYCIDVCKRISDSNLDDDEQNAKQFLLAERALFAFSIGLGMYLRVSEFVANDTYTPTHKDFWRDRDGHYWFKTIGKGNVERDITVSNDVLAALIRFRRVLDLPDYPSPSDHTPLLPSVGNDVWDSNKGWITKLVPLTDTLTVWKIFKWVFAMARAQMIADGKANDAYELLYASSHWLRHTGISNDAQSRPIMHIMADAGHQDSSTTWSYVQSTHRDRALSKKNAERG